VQDFTINVTASLFVLFVLWRINKFGVLPRLEALYLSRERQLAAFILFVAPVVIPVLMLVAWGFIGFFLLRTNGDELVYLFVGWSVFVFLIGPLFERERPLYRVISEWYSRVASKTKS